MQETDEAAPNEAIVERESPVVFTTPAVTNERLEGMCVLLRSLGGVPSTINDSSFEVMSPYLQGHVRPGGSGSRPEFGF